MTLCVIDTNVLLVASGAHDGVSLACRAACIERLSSTMNSGRLAIDDRHRIISEYLNALSRNRNRGVGYVFAKWVAQNAHNLNRVEAVRLTEAPKDFFDEFEPAALQGNFDAPDRKFVAVANGHPENPPIVQATDCKWIDWWKAFLLFGIQVEFICEDDICGFYRQKFPSSGEPEMP